MPLRSPHRFGLAFLIASSALLAFPAVAADDAPSPGASISDEGPDASPRLDVATVRNVPRPLPKLAPRLRVLSIDAGDKGSTFTDGAFDEPPAAPNAFERIKLERARMAIEAARASGVLFRFQRPALPFMPLSEEERTLQKMRDLEAMGRRVRVPAGDPIASPGAPAMSRQLRGPQGLSELEQRKLDAFRNGVELVIPPVEAKAEKPRPMIDAGRKDGKEDR